MRTETIRALRRRLTDFDRVVEVGIGTRHDVARSLAETGTTVVATDVHPRSVPAGVTFVVDDVTDPDESVYEDTEALYALNSPPDLQRPIYDLAKTLDVPFLFTTLGAEPPVVPADPEALPGETLFRSRYEPGGASIHR